MTTKPHGQRTVREMFLDEIRNHVASVQKAADVISKLRKKHPRKPDWELQVMASTESVFRNEIGMQQYYARKANMYGQGAILQAIEAQTKVIEAQTRVLDKMANALIALTPKPNTFPNGNPIPHFSTQSNTPPPEGSWP